MASGFLARALGRFLPAVVLLAPALLPAQDAPWRPRTEQEWIIASITQDVLELTSFAAAPKSWSPLAPGTVRVDELPAKEGQRVGMAYRLRRPGQPEGAEFRIATQPWDPQLYAALPGGTPPPAAAGDMAPEEEAKLLSRLAGLAGREYVTENQRLSWHLTEHPADAAAHEQAALMLGALALRENSGVFWDPRPAMNRAVAHLAVSRILRRASAPGTDSGALAEILIGLIIDTKTDCTRRIAALRPRVAEWPELGPWLRAAEMRNSRDYRLLDDPSGATALERVECFRATCEAMDSGVAVRRLRALGLERLPDWSRTLLQFGVRVGDGARVTAIALPAEFREFAEVLPLDEKSPAAVAAALNVAPGRALRRDGAGRPELNVIDPGMWGAFFQRHLLHVGARTYFFYRYMWGLPDKAEAFAGEMRQALGKLALYPFAEMMMNRDRFMSEERRGNRPSPAETPTGVLAVMRERPEIVEPYLWEKAARRDRPAGEAAPPGVPAGDEWFRPAVPEGTALSVLSRWQFLPQEPAAFRAECERIHAIAPLSYYISARLLKLRAGDKPPRAEFDRLMAPFLAYNHYALRQQADLPDTTPEDAVKIFERLVADDANQLTRLAYLYRKQNRADDAIRTYERAIKESPDPVGVANDLDWVVNELFDRGEKERAERAAKFGAEVYSFNGLETMARLMERMERWDEAESYFQKIAERYDGRGPLAGFYARRVAADPGGAYAAKFRAESARMFPGGMREVTLADFSGPPVRGVVLKSVSAHTRRADLKLGAVIVALDGKAVETVDQFTYVRAMKSTGALELIVWQDGVYRAVRADPPNRRFGVDLAAWPERR